MKSAYYETEPIMAKKSTTHGRPATIRLRYLFFPGESISDGRGLQTEIIQVEI